MSEPKFKAGDTAVVIETEGIAPIRSMLGAVIKIHSDGKKSDPTYLYSVFYKNSIVLLYEPELIKVCNGIHTKYKVGMKVMVKVPEEPSRAWAKGHYDSVKYGKVVYLTNPRLGIIGVECVVFGEKKTILREYDASDLIICCK